MPTITSFDETPYATLRVPPSEPMSSMPDACVQRKARWS
jgi:hypothetical protein